MRFLVPRSDENVRKDLGRDVTVNVQVYTGDDDHQCPPPDVETLAGLTLDAFRRICVWLSLTDVRNCMETCKEWRSALDAREFWRSYLRHRYSFELDEPPPTSPFALWTYARFPAIDNDENDNSDPARWRRSAGSNSKMSKLPYIVKPEPDRWRYGVVVPHGLLPPDGSVDSYHPFVRAMDRVGRLREDLRNRHTAVMAEVCLFQWPRDRLPTPREVMDVFGFHIQISQSEPMLAIEVKAGEIIQRAAIVLSDKSGKYPPFLADVMRLLASLTNERTLFFQCSRDVVRPALGVLITWFADGWMGGVIYGF